MITAILDEDLNIIKKAKNFYGEQETLGKNSLDIIHPDDLFMMKKVYADVLSLKQREAVFRVRKNNEYKYIKRRFVPIVQNKEIIILSVLPDAPHNLLYKETFEYLENLYGKKNDWNYDVKRLLKQLLRDDLISINEVKKVFKSHLLLYYFPPIISPLFLNIV